VGSHDKSRSELQQSHGRTKHHSAHGNAPTFEILMAHQEYYLEGLFHVLRKDQLSHRLHSDTSKKGSATSDTAVEYSEVEIAQALLKQYAQHSEFKYAQAFSSLLRNASVAEADTCADLAMHGSVAG
jgi:hypothetical protein